MTRMAARGNHFSGFIYRYFYFDFAGSEGGFRNRRKHRLNLLDRLPLQLDPRFANGYFRITRFTGLSQRDGKQERNNDDRFTDLIFQPTAPYQSHHYPSFTLAASVR